MPKAALGCERQEIMINSSIVCEEISETGENTQVTIVISDTCGGPKNEGKSQSVGNSNTRLGGSVTTTPSSDPHHFTRCLQHCLKVASSTRTHVCCFVCGETFISFVELKEHLSEAHHLSHSVTQLPNLPSHCISEIAQEIKKLECKCATFMCTTCEVTFSSVLQLVQHVLLDHPTHCGDFTLFTEHKQKKGFEKCQRCTVLDKLCHVDYNLFVRVLLECVECCDHYCRTLLLSWPLPHYSEPCEWCSEEGEHHNQVHNTPSTHGAQREVVCYKIKQKLSNKYSQKNGTPKCICPLMKCPECPKTVANYAELRKHVRQNNHTTWQDLKLIWDKYKTIKENCPVCPKHSYHTYILCPQCPHLDFKSERDAQTHMDSQHNTQAGDKIHAACTCPNHFTCLHCTTSCPTPQSLHQHMREMEHETPQNFAAIPAMMKESIRSRVGCPRCSLQDSHGALDTQLKDDQCSCRWTECSTCKSSFRRVSGLLDHTQRAKHPMSAKDIRKEREKLASSMITCERCCIEANKYCVLCHRKENFMYTHLKSLHQDCQVMLLTDDCGNLLEEHHAQSKDCGRLARYECSVCRICYPRVNELVCHVRRRHPHRYFLLMCLDLSEDVRQVKDFLGHDHLMLLNVVDKKT